MLHRLMKEFIEHSERTVERMRASFASEDREVLKREAHSLRGSATYVGGMAVSAKASALEKACGEPLQPLGTLNSGLVAIEDAVFVLQQAIHYKLSNGEHGAPAPPPSNGRSPNPQASRPDLTEPDRAPAYAAPAVSEPKRSDPTPRRSDPTPRRSVGTPVADAAPLAEPLRPMFSSLVAPKVQPINLVNTKVLEMQAELLASCSGDMFSFESFRTGVEQLHRCALAASVQQDLHLRDTFDLLRTTMASTSEKGESLRKRMREAVSLLVANGSKRLLVDHLDEESTNSSFESRQGKALELDEEVTARVMQRFITMGRHVLAQITEAVRTGQLRHAAIEAHSMRSMAMYVFEDEVPTV